MKKVIIVSLCYFAANGLSSRANDVGGEEIKTKTQQSTVLSLYDAICELAVKSNLVFCFEGAEMNRAALVRREVTSAPTTNGVDQVLMLSKKAGLLCGITNGVIMVMPANHEEASLNSLDAEFDKFVFEGSHKEFVAFFTGSFHGILPPSILEMGGPTSIQRYRINMPNHPSAREVLLYVASTYRVGWTALVFDTMPRMVPPSSDDKRAATSASSVMLLFHQQEGNCASHK